MLNPRTLRNGGDSVRTEAVVRYWGRKSPHLAQFYIQRYSRPNQIVADYFGGSGVFVKSALGLNRRAIYVDLNPFAHLVAKTTIGSCNPEEFVRASQTIISHSRTRFKRKKSYSCDSSEFFSVGCKCGRWREVQSVTYGRRYERLRSRPTNLQGDRDSVFKTIAAKRGITHDALVMLHPDVSTQVLSSIVKWLVKKKFVRESEFVLEARFSAACPCGRQRLALPNKIDWRISGDPKPFHWHPDDRLEYQNGVSFLKQRDVIRLSELYTSRNLAALASIWHSIRELRVRKDVKDCLRLAFMATAIRSSKMCRDEGGTWPVNSYWIPRTYVVRNPYVVFKRAVGQIYRLLKGQTGVVAGSPREVVRDEAQVSFLHADSTKLRLKDNTVDYVIVDPPHTDEAQYFELSLFYTSWLKRRLNFSKEVIINKKQGKDTETYFGMLREASNRIYDSLKTNHHYTLILHDDNRDFLTQCVNVISDIGFKLVEDEMVSGYQIYTFKK